jgi:hypothetical protein
VRPTDTNRVGRTPTSKRGGWSADAGAWANDRSVWGKAPNSTRREKEVHSRSLVPSSRKASELTIEAIYASRAATRERSFQDEHLPDEGERARLISDITRLIREPQMPETTRTAGLTLIGWLARRMPGEAPHAIGVAEARQSERRLRAAQQRKR